MSSEQERAELDARARQGETVVPGGTGGKSLEAQEHLAEGILFFNSLKVLCMCPHLFLSHGLNVFVVFIALIIISTCKLMKV